MESENLFTTNRCFWRFIQVVCSGVVPCTISGKYSLYGYATITPFTHGRHSGFAVWQPAFKPANDSQHGFVKPGKLSHFSKILRNGLLWCMVGGLFNFITLPNCFQNTTLLHSQTALYENLNVLIPLYLLTYHWSPLFVIFCYSNSYSDYPLSCLWFTFL